MIGYQHAVYQAGRLTSHPTRLRRASRGKRQFGVDQREGVYGIVGGLDAFEHSDRDLDRRHALISIEIDEPCRGDESKVVRQNGISLQTNKEPSTEIPRVA